MGTIEQLRRRAAELVFSGKHHDAARLYEQILDSPARDGDVALRLGSLQRKLGNLAGALASFELAVELFGRTGRFAKAAAAEQVATEICQEMGRRASVSLMD